MEFYVVVYRNKIYKGYNEYAATAKSLSGGTILYSSQDRVFMTTPNLSRAVLFKTREEAIDYCKTFPVLDFSHFAPIIRGVKEKVIKRTLTT